MSALQTISKRPVRVYRAPEFKSKLVKLALEPDASVSGVAVAHGVNPNLLRRWIKESGALMPPPTFVPVRIESGFDRHVHAPAINSQHVEVNIDRGDLRIAFKVDPTQMVELGQVLREVLR
ncbi:MAG: transposase [Gammaproteobacteria bacterium]|nr:transposase [Gammaproteobacteria bacterium]MBU2680664.1 transposase [Gammaproteobacteria bacterium]